MDQSLPLQRSTLNGSSLRAEDITSKSHRRSILNQLDAQKKEHSSVQPVNSNVHQPSSLQAGTHRGGGGGEASHRSGQLMNPVEYKVNVYAANVQVAESQTKINNTSTTQNNRTSTAPIHQLTNRLDSSVVNIPKQSLMVKLLGCSFSRRMLAYFMTQILEKFFFFTLFINCIDIESVQIVVGIVYGLTSAVKYFVFIYIFNSDLRTCVIFAQSTTSTSTYHDNSSEEASVASQPVAIKSRMRYCEKCEENVAQATFHCENCSKCIYQPFFHSKSLGICVTTRNKMLLIVIAILNIFEAILAVVFIGISIQMILSDEDNFKQSLIKIFQNASQSVLLVISVIILFIICVCLILNGFFLRVLKSSNKVQKTRPMSSLYTLREQQSKLSVDLRGSAYRKDIPVSSAVPSSLRQLHTQKSQHPQNFTKSISGLSNPDQKRFESHWRISPPDGRIEDQQLASLNNSGSIFNFISKKISSFENLDKLTVHSPSKTAKSLSSIDHPSFKKTKKNFSELDIIARNSPEKGNGNALGVIARKRNTLIKSATGKKQSLPPINEALKNFSTKDVSDFIPNMRKSEGPHDLNQDIRDESQQVYQQKNFSILSNLSQFQPQSRLQN